MAKGKSLEMSSGGLDFDRFMKALVQAKPSKTEKAIKKHVSRKTKRRNESV